MDPLFVDCDPALGLPFRDIDDALALHALHAAGAPVVGITTVFGNAPQPRVHAVAERLGARFGIPVHGGARHPGDVATAAVDRLVAHRGAVLGLGPCTNLAAALERGARWSRLVLLGGTERPAPNLRYLHLTELNFALDVAAANRTLAACDVLVGMEVCRTVVCTADDIPVEFRREARSWTWIAPWLTGTRGFHPWDLVAAWIYLHPEAFRYTPRRFAVEARWPRRGRLVPGPCRVAMASSVDERLLGSRGR